MAGRRISLHIRSNGRSVTLSLSGATSSQHVLFELPAFVDNIESASDGTVDQRTGTVSLSPIHRTVTVDLRRPVVS